MAPSAKAVRAQRQRGEATGLTEDELAFYDALGNNESARLALQDVELKTIAHELTEIVRNDAKTDWQVKETVRAKLRTRIKRLVSKTICFSRSVEIHEKVIGSFIEKHMFY